MEELFALLASDFTPNLTGIAFYGVLVLLGTVIGLMTGFFGGGGGFLTVMMVIFAAIVLILLDLLVF